MLTFTVATWLTVSLQPIARPIVLARQSVFTRIHINRHTGNVFVRSKHQTGPDHKVADHEVLVARRETNLRCTPTKVQGHDGSPRGSPIHPLTYFNFKVQALILNAVAIRP